MIKYLITSKLVNPHDLDSFSIDFIYSLMGQTESAKDYKAQFEKIWDERFECAPDVLRHQIIDAEWKRFLRHEKDYWERPEILKQFPIDTSAMPEKFKKAFGLI